MGLLKTRTFTDGSITGISPSQHRVAKDAAARFCHRWRHRVRALAPVTQQERMKTCNTKAADKKGDERKAFMSECLKADRKT